MCGQLGLCLCRRRLPRLPARTRALSSANHSVGFVLTRAADLSAKSAQAPTSVQAGPCQGNSEGIRPSGSSCKKLCPRWHAGAGAGGAHRSAESSASRRASVSCRIVSACCLSSVCARSARCRASAAARSASRVSASARARARSIAAASAASASRFCFWTSEASAASSSFEPSCAA